MGKLFKLGLKQNSYNFTGSSAKIAHSCVDYWSVFTIDQFKIQMTKEKIPRNPYLIYFLDAQFVLL